MPTEKNTDVIPYKDYLVAVPFLGTALAMTWEVGRFFPMEGFFYFSLSEHLISAIYALPLALFFLVIAVVFSNSERVRRGDPMVEGFLDVFIITLMIAALCALAYLSGQSAFFYSLAGCLTILLMFRPKPGSAANLLTLFTASLVLALTLGIDWTRLELFASKDLTNNITTKTETLSGRVMMIGERGVLLYFLRRSRSDF